MQVRGVAGVAQAVDCTNVTIADADDAADVRGSCTVITGNLGFSKTLSEDINLDGVTEIQGDITHSGCEEAWDDCTIPDAFTISSTTLTKVGGAIDFWYFQGLQELSFPALTEVQGSVSLKRLHQLKTLDITKLARLGYFILEAQNLTKLEHEGLEGFTGENKYGAVAFWAAAVTNVDSFFNHPIEANGSADQSGVTISGEYLPNLDRLNFAWAKVPRLWVSGNNINVTLGNSRASAMEIDSLVLKGNITALNRHSAVKNLTVGGLTVEADDYIEELELPFDHCSGLSVATSDSLQSIKLPRAALSWEDFDLSISSCDSLNLASQYDGDEQLWYWPEKNMSKISITGVNVTNGFFDSFLDYHANGNNSLKVLKEFTISPNQNQETSFNCTPFDDLKSRGVLPSDYKCDNVTESAASPIGLHGLWHYGAASAAIAFYLI
ncbi:hypothetical protein B0T10DRAFT_578751 [Thelonectria olida]|uniref:Uncharacterized protein n=1 Tax=Thelonectria olida TaxID=1576542 RepID=A0A9P8WJ16_9HYPO|nr:hypothetical protein B0T10DRAFT_578751 [Thelonectria olida]